MNAQRQTHSGILFMLLGIFCFAIVNAMAKLMPHIPVHELIFFRSIVSFSFCAWYVNAHGIPFWGNNKKWLALRGLLGLVALTLFFSTIKNMPLATASVIQYLSPIFTVLIATQLNNQPVLRIQWVYFAIAFAGVVCVKGFDERVSLFWLSIGIVSAVFSGFAYNAIIKSKGTDHPMTIVMYFPMIALPFTGIACLFHWVQPVGWDWLWLLLMSIFTQIAQYATTIALHTDQASKVTPWNYFGALFAVIIGYVLFDEGVDYMSFLGMLLIVFGVVMNSRLKTQKVA
jgi:drug/metabolite transporter (DMT)-like permease